MIRQILAITVKDLKVLLKDRGGLMALFLMPLMFILVMSVALKYAFQVGGSDQPIQILTVNEDAGSLAEEVMTEIDALEGVDLIRTWDDAPLTLARAEQAIVDGDAYVALYFPEDFSAAVEAAALDPQADPAEVRFIVDPTAGETYLSPIRGTVEGYVQKAASYAQVPLRIESDVGDFMAALPPEAQPAVAPYVGTIAEAFGTALTSGAEDSSGVTFTQTVPDAYEVPEYPDSVEQNVPAYTIFGMFFIVQTVAGSILMEKYMGTFRRLLAAPLNKSVILLGKILPYYLVNLIQVVIMFAVGRFVFDMSLGNSFLGMVMVSMSTAAAATGLGLLVAAFGKTQQQSEGFATILVLTLAAVGGMMVPTMVMPEFLQTLSKISPHAWALSGYQDLIVRGMGAAAVTNESLILCGYALAFFAIAVWRFRFQEE